MISGPSGAGKGTLVREVLQRIPDAWVSISATTRPPRPGERDGVEYHFLSKEEFRALIEGDGLLEWAEVFGNYYGTPRREAQEHIRRGDQVLLEIDVQGGAQVKRALPEAVLVFVEPPSLDELKSRLVNRGSESEQQIDERLRHAGHEMGIADSYDHRVVNDDLSGAVAEFIGIVDYYAGQEE